jgi:glycosyltransferase involved in cell wall biosynthesis
MESLAALPDISVVIVAKNEELRIARALEHVLAMRPAEIIVVDGLSSDRTVEIARSYPGVQVIMGGRGVAGDRQKGVDAAKSALVCLIDADHRPAPTLLAELHSDLVRERWVMVQAGVTIEETGFWTRAENEAFAVFHHKPGARTMIGTAPTLYRKSLFDRVRFDESNRQVSDDADFCLRVTELGGMGFGVSAAKVPQEHHASLEDYWKKFRVYGREDAGFCWKHPHRAPSMLFHLFFRYPVIRPLKAALSGKWRAIPYFWLCAIGRQFAMAGRLLELMSGAVLRSFRRVAAEPNI